MDINKNLNTSNLFNGVSNEADKNISRALYGNPNKYNKSNYDKELIILSCCLSTGNASAAKAKHAMENFRGYMAKEVEDININTKYYIKALFIHGHETKIECIYPTVNVLPQEIMNKLLNFEGNIEL